MSNIIDPDISKVISDHEKRISDLERHPLGCIEYHEHFFVACRNEDDLPDVESGGGGIGVGYLVLDTGCVWAWTGIPGFGGVWNDGGDPCRSLDDWLP